MCLHTLSRVLHTKPKLLGGFTRWRAGYTLAQFLPVTLDMWKAQRRNVAATTTAAPFILDGFKGG